MQGGSVTTPFGRRSMTLGMLASQYMSREIAPETSADKWKLFRSLCEAKPRLGISERALSVMNALLSFYPKATLSEENGLIVFPSNMQLSLRAHGMAEATLRRHIAALVDAGLLARRDSPNGNRYARKDGDGAIDEAFGFSLAPLLARAREIEQMAADVEAERLQLRRVRERLAICRRDIGKLIEVALDEGVDGDWGAIHQHYRSLVVSIPRAATAGTIEPILEEMEMLRDEISNLLEIRIKARNLSGNPDQTERHKQNSNPESTYELEPSSRKEQGAKPSKTNEPPHEPIKGFRCCRPALPSPIMARKALWRVGATSCRRQSWFARRLVSVRPPTRMPAWSWGRKMRPGHGVYPRAGRAHQFGRWLPA